jgi:hypothetical protein
VVWAMASEGEQRKIAATISAADLGLAIFLFSFG